MYSENRESLESTIVLFTLYIGSRSYLSMAFVLSGEAHMPNMESSEVILSEAEFKTVYF